MKMEFRNEHDAVIGRIETDNTRLDIAIFRALNAQPEFVWDADAECYRVDLLNFMPEGAQPPAPAIVVGAWQENADYVLCARKTYYNGTVYFERNGRDQHPRFTPHMAEARIYKSRRGARGEILRLKQRYPDNQTIARLEEMPR